MSRKKRRKVSKDFKLDTVFEDRRENGKEENEDRIAELERMVGRLTMENDILKKARSWLAAAARRNGR